MAWLHAGTVFVSSLVATKQFSCAPSITSSTSVRSTWESSTSNTDWAYSLGLGSSCSEFVANDDKLMACSIWQEIKGTRGKVEDRADRRAPCTSQ